MSSVRPGVKALTADLDGHERAYLELEALASAAFYQFAFHSAGAAMEFRQLLLERGAAEYAPPAARLLLIDGEPAGMFAVLPSALVQKRRLAAAIAIARDARYRDDSALQDRLRLAGSLLQRPERDDAYLSRIAVAPRAAGQGLGRWLLERALDEARLLGAHRCILDVSDDNARAIAFYLRAGFVEAGRSVTEDPSTGRRLGYLRMTTTLSRAGARAIRSRDDQLRNSDGPIQRSIP